MTTEAISSFTGSLGFIIFFLLGTLFFTMAFGEDAAVWYLVLVMLGMLMVNWDKFETVIGRYSGA